MGREADADSRRAQLRHLPDVLVHGPLAEACEPAARVGDVQEGDFDACSLRCLGGGERFREAEVVELADGRVSGGAHLTICALVRDPD